MQGGNARYGHFGRSGGATRGGVGPSSSSAAGASQSDLMFSLSGDIPSSSASLHYQSQHPAFHEGGGGSRQDPGGGGSSGPYHARPPQPGPTTTLGFDHHRRQQQQLGFDLGPQMQWQATTGFDMAHHRHQHQHSLQPQPQPPPHSSHDFLMPPPGPVAPRGFEPNPRHQPQQQQQQPQPQPQPQSHQHQHQHQHPGGRFKPLPHHREARTVHRQLGFESDSPEPLSSPLSEDPPRPPNPNPNPNPTNNNNNNTSLGNEQLAPNPALGLDDEDDDGDGDHDGTPEAAHSRWTKKETLALLNVRGQIGAQFQESSAKWPLWEDISRKLAEMGFNKSAKKCKEKFENIQKYYKKTKEGKASRPERKNYRFFNQLEAIFGGTGCVGSMLMNNEGEKNESSMQGNNNIRNMPESLNSQPCSRVPLLSLGERSFGGLPNATMETDCSSPFSFSSSSSDESPAAEGRKKQKKKASTKKVLQFFDHLMNKVIWKQEQLHQRLLEALEKREKERMAREEAWRRQEMARLGRELELRSQERALAESRNTALDSYLQQATGKRGGGGGVPAPFISIASPVRLSTLSKEDGKSLLNLGYKRWPKPEVLALIKFRSTLEARFLEPGTKGRVWKDVSREMASLGFNRSAKRCREKWENINRYYLKTRESNKKRMETSKTCPYFTQLDDLYRNGLLSSPQKLALPEPSEKQNNDPQEESGQPQQGSDSEALATTAAERD